jgi:hypothetical protein
MWVVHVEMRGLINEADKIEQIERREAEQDTKTVSDTRRRVDAALARVRQEIGEQAASSLEELAKGVARVVLDQVCT